MFAPLRGQHYGVYLTYLPHDHVWYSGSLCLIYDPIYAKKDVHVTRQIDRASILKGMYVKGIHKDTFWKAVTSIWSGLGSYVVNLRPMYHGITINASLLASDFEVFVRFCKPIKSLYFPHSQSNATLPTPFQKKKSGVRGQGLFIHSVTACYVYL